MKKCFTEYARQAIWLMVLWIVAFGFIIYTYVTEGDLNYAGTLILAVTFAAIMGNTIATWDLKRLTSKQITLSIRPIVVCIVEDYIFKVRNVGNNVALHIETKEIPIKIDKKSERMPELKDAKYLKVEGITCLEKNPEEKWRSLDTRIFGEDKKTRITSLNSRPQILKDILMDIPAITLHYKDIAGAEYRTHLENKEGHWETIGFS